MLTFVLVLLAADPASPSCVVYGEKKAAVAGLLQIEAPAEGSSAKSFDRQAAAFWLADDRARTCNARGTLKLPSNCIFMIDLGAKRAVFHDGQRRL